jgi:hypothetical protein
MDMVISGTNHEDVAEPDAMASGAAGTGQEYRNSAGPAECSRGKSPKRRDRIMIWLGVLSPGRGTGTALPETPAPSSAAPADDWSREEEGGIDLIFALYERDERIAERLERKISRLEKRLEQIEEKGRS